MRLLYYSRLFCLHVGEGQTETAAEEVARFTPLLSSFCRRNRRERPSLKTLYSFPQREHASSKARPRFPPPSTSRGNKMLVQL